jgi:hypothetical protein
MWNGLKEKTTNLEATAKKRFNELRPLLAYLDKEIMEVPVAQMKQVKRSISLDIERLETLVLKIMETIKLIEGMVIKGQVAEILQIETLYNEFKHTFDEVKYLESISLEVLAKLYHEALLRDNERALDGFTQEHRDLYMKLKFKAFRGAGHQMIIGP